MAPLYEGYQSCFRMPKLDDQSSGSFKIDLSPKKTYRPSDFPSPFSRNWKENPYNFIKWNGNWSTITYGIAHLIGQSQPGTIIGKHRPGQRVEEDKFHYMFLNDLYYPKALVKEGFALEIILDKDEHILASPEHHGKKGYKLSREGAAWVEYKLKNPDNYKPF